MGFKRSILLLAAAFAYAVAVDGEDTLYDPIEPIGPIFSISRTELLTAPTKLPGSIDGDLDPNSSRSPVYPIFTDMLTSIVDAPTDAPTDVTTDVPSDLPTDTFISDLVSTMLNLNSTVAEPTSNNLTNSTVPQPTNVTPCVDCPNPPNNKGQENGKGGNPTHDKKEGKSKKPQDGGDKAPVNNAAGSVTASGMLVLALAAVAGAAVAI